MYRLKGRESRLLPSWRSPPTPHPGKVHSKRKRSLLLTLLKTVVIAPRITYILQLRGWFGLSSLRAHGPISQRSTKPREAPRVAHDTEGQNLTLQLPGAPSSIPDSQGLGGVSVPRIISVFTCLILSCSWTTNNW